MNLRAQTGTRKTSPQSAARNRRVPCFFRLPARLFGARQVPNQCWSWRGSLSPAPGSLPGHRRFPLLATSQTGVPVPLRFLVSTGVTCALTWNFSPCCWYSRGLCWSLQNEGALLRLRLHATFPRPLHQQNPEHNCLLRRRRAGPPNKASTTPRNSPKGTFRGAAERPLLHARGA